MGLAIDRERFDALEYRRFEGRLQECLVALERLLKRPGFGAGPATVGAELELFLIDGQGRALPAPACRGGCWPYQVHGASSGSAIRRPVSIVGRIRT